MSRLWRYGALFLLAAFLLLRASQPNRFSEWFWGDAQTLMASSVFRDEGFLATGFLWVPQWSSPVGKFLDDPAVRHHAHGSAGDSFFSGLGPLRVYTHWPSWYSLPYGVIAKFSISKFAFQVWAIFLSLLSVAFLSLFLRELFPDSVALIGTFLYLASPAFLGYADSLATMPYDDLFRFLFLWTWSRELKRESPNRKKLGLIFLGSTLTSLDSVLFIPMVALVTEAARKKTVPLVTLFWLAGAGILAMLVQFLQNTFYLGWKNAWADWYGYFIGYGSTTWFSRFEAVNALFCETLPAEGFWGLFAVIFIFLLSRGSKNRFWIWALFLGGAAFPFVLPRKVLMSYEIRQFMPFLCVGMAAAAGELFKVCRALASIPLRKTVIGSVGVILWALAMGFFYQFDQRSLHYFVDFPAQSRLDPKLVDFLGGLNLRNNRNAVVFQFGDAFTTRKFSREGYGQADPLEEYFAGAPVFTIPDVSALKADLNYFWERSKGQVRPFLIVHDRDTDLTRLEKELSRGDFPGKWKIIFQGSERTALEWNPNFQS